MYSVMFGEKQVAYFKDKTAAFEYRDSLEGIAEVLLKTMTDSGRAPAQDTPVFYVIEWKGDGTARRISR